MGQKDLSLLKRSFHLVVYTTECSDLAYCSQNRCCFQIKRKEGPCIMFWSRFSLMINSGSFMTPQCSRSITLRCVEDHASTVLESDEKKKEERTRKVKFHILENV